MHFWGLTHECRGRVEVNLQEIAERLFGAVFGAGGGPLVHTHFSKVRMPNYCRLVRLPRLVRAMPNARVPGALRGVLPLVLWCWCLRCGAGAVVLVLVLWCWCCGAGAGAVVLVLVLAMGAGCIPHPAQGHRRTRAGHAAYALAPTHKPRVVGYRTRPRGCFEVRAKRGTVEASPTPLRNPT